MTSDMPVLLVEDDEVDQMVVLRGLKSAGLNNPVTVANNGQEALNRLRGANGFELMPQPCLVLLDLNMPVMNGHEFLDELRRDDALRATIVFVLSSSDLEMDMRRCYAHNVAGYICKSSTVEDIRLLAQFVQAYSQIVSLGVPV